MLVCGSNGVNGSDDFDMTLTRRSIIQSAGTAGSLMLVGGLPMWARGAQPPAEPAPPDYLKLSSALLGVEAEQLEPEARGGGVPLADSFHALCLEAAPAATAALLAAWRETGGGAAPADSPEAAAIAGALLAGGGRPPEDGVGALARLTMLMWLYGVWYGATETARRPGSAAVIGPDHRTDLAVSVRAYRAGWIWRFAQTRPMGVAGAPGGWAEPPPDLDTFLGGS